MTTFRSFEEIEAWKESRVLLLKIRNICRQQRAAKDYAFVDQITRACRSISANIAEGNDSMSRPEFIKFLSYAKRSAAEVRSHLYDAKDEKYISTEEFQDLTEHSKVIARMLAKLISYLSMLERKR